MELFIYQKVNDDFNSIKPQNTFNYFFLKSLESVINTKQARFGNERNC